MLQFSLLFSLAQLGCILAILSSTFGCSLVHAYSSELYGEIGCQPGDLIGTATKLASGSCIDLNRISAKATCADDGTVSTQLYLVNGCQALAGSGSGLGNGVACIRYVMVDGSSGLSARIDCSAPGPDPPLSSGAIAGIVVACIVVGLAVIAGVGLHCYRSHKAAAFIANNTMHMQQQQLPGPAHDQAVSNYPPSVGPHTAYATHHPPMPGKMMAVALLVIVCLSSVPGVAAMPDPEMTAAILIVGTIVFFSTGIVGFLLCCCPIVLVRFGRAFFAF